MKRVSWMSAIACALACISCGDALGLHDLVEGHPVGAGAEAAVPDILTLDAGVEETGAPSPSAASSPAPSANDVTPVGFIDAGNTPPGASSPSPLPDAAPLPDPDASAGFTKDAASQPPPDAGVPPCRGSGFTTHQNGVGQSFQDCVPAGTHDSTQALAACAAFTGSRATCSIATCSGNGGGSDNESTSEQGVCSTGASVCNCWSVVGPNVGLVQSDNKKKCEPCANGGNPWN